MNRRHTIVGVLIIVLLSAMNAWGEGLPWKSHQAPFDFVFGNHIDTHQQTRPEPGGSLFGYVYISFTGEYTADGIPIAAHRNCDQAGAECSVGWRVTAVPGEAIFVAHEAGDHPLWFVEHRADIPQPGAFSHFHWAGDPGEASALVPGQAYEGYFLEFRAKDTFVFRLGTADILVVPGVDISTHLNIVPTLP